MKSWDLPQKRSECNTLAEKSGSSTFVTTRFSVYTLISLVHAYYLRVNVREIFNLSGRSIFELSKIIFLMMIGMMRGVQKGTFQISMLLRYWDIPPPQNGRHFVANLQVAVKWVVWKIKYQTQISKWLSIHDKDFLLSKGSSIFHH